MSVPRLVVEFDPRVPVSAPVTLANIAHIRPLPDLTTLTWPG